MENIDKIKCVLIDFEQNDKTLDEAATEILRLFSVVGRSKQLFCDVCNSTDDVQSYCCKCMDERC
jgi:hypothetical protein